MKDKNTSKFASVNLSNRIVTAIWSSFEYKVRGKPKQYGAHFVGANPEGDERIAFRNRSRLCLCASAHHHEPGGKVNKGPLTRVCLDIEAREMFDVLGNSFLVADTPRFD